MGALVAWAVDKSFFPFYFFLVMVGVVFNHVALNMADDYFDYRHAVDRSKPDEKNPYSGGSGTLGTGLIKPGTMFLAFCLCFLVTITIGLYLTAERGIPVLIFGLVGVFCSVFYTAPPLNFSHYSLGEIGQLINFGTTIGLGSYFVQTQRIGIEAFVATLPMGIMLFSMIIINEIPDYENDKLAGKITLVARYGRIAGIRLYIASWACTYSVIVIAAIFGILPLLALLGLASLPLATRSILHLQRNFEDPVRLAPANLDMIVAHGVTSLALITSFAITGLLGGANPSQLVMILIILALAYVPALFATMKPKPV